MERFVRLSLIASYNISEIDRLLKPIMSRRMLMQKLIRIEPEKCVGCKTCELACSFKNAGEFAPSKSRIYNEVFLEEAKFITVTCMQCDEP